MAQASEDLASIEVHATAKRVVDGGAATIVHVVWSPPATGVHRPRRARRAQTAAARRAAAAARRTSAAWVSWALS